MGLASGYHGELVVADKLTPRWVCWFVSTAVFCYIVYDLLVGLANTGRLLGLLSVLSFGGCFSEGTYDYALPYYNGVSFGKVARWALAPFGQGQVLDLAATDPAPTGFGVQDTYQRWLN